MRRMFRLFTSQFPSAFPSVLLRGLPMLVLVAACAAPVGAPSGAPQSAAPTQSSAGNPTQSAAGNASGTVGVTADTITLGMVTPLTGATASIGTDGKAGADAFVAWINDQGGINGRKLKLVAQDDQYNPQSSVTATKYFVDQQPVLAIWGNIGTATSLATVPTLESAKIPLLFPMALSSEFDKSAMVFQMQPGYDRMAMILSNWMAKNQPDAKMAVLYQNDGTAVAVADGFKLGKQPLIKSELFERTATTYRPQLQSLKDAGADNVLATFNDVPAAVALKESQEMGFKPQWWGTLGMATPKFMELAGPDLAEGTRAVILSASPDSAVPGAKQFRDAMQKYQGQAGGTYALNSWIGGLIIADALKRAGPNLTRQGLIDALQSTSALDTGGLTPPVTLDAQNRIAVRGIKIIQVKSGKWEEISDWITEASVK